MSSDNNLLSVSIEALSKPTYITELASDIVIEPDNMDDLDALVESNYRCELFAPDDPSLSQPSSSPGDSCSSIADANYMKWKKSPGQYVEISRDHASYPKHVGLVLEPASTSESGLIDHYLVRVFVADSTSHVVEYLPHKDLQTICTKDAKHRLSNMFPDRDSPAIAIPSIYNISYKSSYQHGVDFNKSKRLNKNIRTIPNSQLPRIRAWTPIHSTVQVCHSEPVEKPVEKSVQKPVGHKSSTSIISTPTLDAVPLDLDLYSAIDVEGYAAVSTLASHRDPNMLYVVIYDQDDDDSRKSISDSAMRDFYCNDVVIDGMHVDDDLNEDVDDDIDKSSEPETPTQRRPLNHKQRKSRRIMKKAANHNPTCSYSTRRSSQLTSISRPSYVQPKPGDWVLINNRYSEHNGYVGLVCSNNKASEPEFVSIEIVYPYNSTCGMRVVKTQQRDQYLEVLNIKDVKRIVDDAQWKLMDDHYDISNQTSIVNMNSSNRKRSRVKDDDDDDDEVDVDETDAENSTQPTMIPVRQSTSQTSKARNTINIFNWKPKPCKVHAEYILDAKKLVPSLDDIINHLRQHRMQL